MISTGIPMEFQLMISVGIPINDFHWNSNGIPTSHTPIRLPHPTVGVSVRASDSLKLNFVISTDIIYGARR